MILSTHKESARRVVENTKPTPAKEVPENRQSLDSDTSMRNLHLEVERSISPKDFANPNKIAEGKSSRNRQVVSPSQRSTKMVSKGSAVQQSKEDAEELIPTKVELESKEELKSIESANSDNELMSQISKVKSKKKSIMKEVSEASKEEVDEKTELDKSSIRIEESEGDESEESEDEEDSEDTPRDRSNRENISAINLNIEILKKELQTEITRVEKKLGFTAGIYFR